MLRAQTTGFVARRAPVYNIYSAFPAFEATQVRMLASIAQAEVRVAFIADVPLVDRDDLRSSKTHPMVWRHLITTMEQVEVLPGGVHVFRERATPAADVSSAIPEVTT